MENTLTSALVSDQMESHMHHTFIDSVRLLGTRMINLPGGLLPFAKMRCWKTEQFKTRLVGQCQAWKVAEYTCSGGTEKFQFLVVWKCLNGLLKFGKNFCH